MILQQVQCSFFFLESYFSIGSKCTRLFLEERRKYLWQKSKYLCVAQRLYASTIYAHSLFPFVRYNKKVSLPVDYPYRSPSIGMYYWHMILHTFTHNLFILCITGFNTRIFHPNIDEGMVDTQHMPCCPLPAR